MANLPSRATKIAAATAICATIAAPAMPSVNDNLSFNVQGIVVVWGADDFDPAGNAPVVSDFILDTGTGNTAATSGDTDLIAGDVHTVITGSLVPTEDATVSDNGTPFRVQRIPGGGFTTDPNNDGIVTESDLFGAFTIRNNSDINTRRAELFTSFFVASNIAFSIDGQATPVGTTSPDAFNRMRLRLRVTQSGNDDGFSFGSSAQFPHTAGAAGGSQANFRRLTTMATQRRVFQGNQRTAAAPGTLADHSVRFDLTYRYNSGNIDLSDGVIEAAAEVVYTVYVP